MVSYKYKAFISYNSKDSICAELIQKWLFLLSKYEDDSSNHNFFRDRTHSELNSTIKNSLESSLENSEWLIVICSQYINDTKKEFNWVEFECNYFKNILNRGNKIICVISSLADDNNEITSFFPECLKEYSDILAADLRKNEDWFMAITKIYSIIFDMSFNNFYSFTTKVKIEHEYSLVLKEAQDLFARGYTNEALKKLFQIDFKYGVRGLEWSFLCSLFTGYIYEDNLGSIKPSIYKNIVFYDNHTNLLCVTNNFVLQIINCYTFIDGYVNPHNNKHFYLYKSYINTKFLTICKDDECVKIWELVNNNIICTKSYTLYPDFYNDKEKIFAGIIKNLRPACFDQTSSHIAIITNATITIINTNNDNIYKYNIPPLTQSPSYPVWNNVYFINQENLLLLEDNHSILIWDLLFTDNIFQWNKIKPKNTYGKNDYSAIYTEDYLYHISKGENYIGYFYKEDIKISEIPLLNEITLDSIYVRNYKENKLFLITIYSNDTIEIFFIHDKKSNKIYQSYDSTLNKDKIDSNNYLISVQNNCIYFEQNIPKDEFIDCIDFKYRNGVIGTNNSNNFIFTIDDQGKKITVLQKNGNLYRQFQVCNKSEKDYIFEEGIENIKNSSPLLKEYIIKHKNPNIYWAVDICVLDANHLVIICSKGKLIIWNYIKDSHEIVYIHDYELKRIISLSSIASFVAIDSENRLIFFENSVKSFEIKTDDIDIVCIQAFPSDTIYIYKENGVLLIYNKDKLYDTIEIGIKNATSAYITHDKTRLIISVDKSIVFIRLNDYTVLVSIYLPTKIMGFLINDDENNIIIKGDNSYKKYILPDLNLQTIDSINKLFAIRREKLFCDNPYLE